MGRGMAPDAEAGRRDGEASPLMGGTPLGDRMRTMHAEKHRQGMVAESKLQSLAIGMLACLLLFFGLLAARLELRSIFAWPMYIDLLPLCVLPCLLYFAASDFAFTRVSEEAALGRAMIIGAGFLTAVCVLMLDIFVCLRLDGGVKWSWTAVFLPLWCMLLVAQFFFCFLIPGFLRADMLKVFVMVFISVWMIALALLLTALKLDGDLPTMPWRGALFPLQLALVLQIVTLDKNLFDLACRCMLLTSLVLLPIQLDGLIMWPWSLILVPIVVLLFVGIAQAANHQDQPARDL